MIQLKMDHKSVTLDLNFTELSQWLKIFEYKGLLFDAICRYASLFIHRDEGKAAWQLIYPIIDYWNKEKTNPFLYRAGTYGPKESDKLLSNDGRQWIDIDNCINWKTFS